jgi:hypothetical protein
VIFRTVTGDVQEAGTLNHYIGMGRIDRAALSDLDFLPFAIGAFALLLLRVVALGDLRSLVDLIALYTYFGVFAFARFAYTLYVFGHNLDPLPSSGLHAHGLRHRPSRTSPSRACRRGRFIWPRSASRCRDPDREPRGGARGPPRR